MENFNINTVEETVGDSDHSNGYSIDKLAEFFHKKYGSSKNPLPKQYQEHIIEKMLWRVSECLRFNVALHVTLIDKIRGLFTENQLYFIIAYLKDQDLDANRECELDEFKYYLINQINYNGTGSFDIGDVDQFICNLELITPLEFVVFFDLIIEKWGCRQSDDGLFLLINSLKK